jgi:hypothetical protein
MARLAEMDGDCDRFLLCIAEIVSEAPVVPGKH